MLGAREPIAFVHVTDAGRARAFYVDVLGLELVEDTPFAVVVRSGHTIVRLTPVPNHRPSLATVLGWDVPDVASVLSALTDHGVVSLRYDDLDQDDQGVWHAPGGARVAWFCDPDGNVLSLTQA